jgi:RNA polymerase sigma factor (sigma-70 family)
VEAVLVPPDGQLRTFLRCLRRVAGHPGSAAPTDGQLLERFLGQHDEAAFELLVWRHGPMVLNVCRRLLHHAEDAEDAFQATFLVFVRKAHAINKREGLGSWLHRVAYRVALRAKAAQAKRARREKATEVEPAVECGDHEEWKDLRPVLDEEIDRLPERYRAAVVLCYLEGKSHQEAARQLGCAEGTVASRLSRARDRLRGRLVRRGLVLSAGALTGALVQSALPAPVSAALVDTTVTAATAFAAGQATAGGAMSAHSAALAEGVMKTMVLTNLKVAAAVLVAAGMIGVGAGGVTYRTLAAGGPNADADPAAASRSARRDRVEVPSRRDGVLLVIGTEIKEGEKVPPGDIIILKVGGEQTKYRRLREGDVVEEGQLLARLDDDLARDEVLSKKTTVNAAKAEWEASVKTRDEALERYKTLQKLATPPTTVSLEDLRGAKLTYDRYFFEEIGKKEAIAKAEAELRQAQTVLRMHEIRSPDRGVIREIYRNRGEAVRALDPVLQLRITEKVGE